VRAIERALQRVAAHFAPLIAESCVTVSSVDGFQGRECDGVVFTAARNNKAGNVGFLKDARRMNVALTRARNSLVVIGSEATLSHDKGWAACAPLG
jgi:superfamily I DNA and/or RNA helicase